MKKNNRNNREHVNYFNKLKTQQLLLEKHEKCTVSFIENNSDSAVEDGYDRMNDARDREMCKLQHDVRDLCERLERIRATVKREKLDRADLADLRNELTTLQKNTNLLRKHVDSRTGPLKCAENKLTAELEIVEAVVEEMNNKPHKVVRSAPTGNSNDRSVPRAIEEFAEFVNASGGHEGGWTADDHLLFVKYRNRYKTASKSVQCLRKLLPDKSEGEVIEHFEWYEKYSELRAKRKEAIAEWKRKKAEKRKNEETERIDGKPTRARSTKNIDRNEIKEKIQKWKVEKAEREDGETAERVSRLAEEKRRRREEALRKKKLEVEEWKNEKKVREQREKLERQMSEKREREQRVALANRMIREFQQLDWFYVKKRRETYLAAKLREFETRSVEATGESRSRPRDPERLLQPTRQWLARTAPDADLDVEPGFTVRVEHINLVPKLAIPDWRKTIS